MKKVVFLSFSLLFSLVLSSCESYFFQTGQVIVPSESIAVSDSMNDDSSK